MATGRLVRERQTLTAMIRMWCRYRHPHTQRGDFCPECTELLAYATARLTHCRFGAAKPTCARCPIHCYRAERRDDIRAIMRWAGPRMMWRHPWLVVMHLIDGWRCPHASAHR